MEYALITLSSSITLITCSLLFGVVVRGAFYFLKFGNFFNFFEVLYMLFFNSAGFLCSLQVFYSWLYASLAGFILVLFTLFYVTCGLTPVRFLFWIYILLTTNQNKKKKKR